MRDLAFIVIAAGLINGCGGGQTKPDDATTQHGQPRCGPQTRCGPSDDDRPPQSSKPVVVHD